MAEGMLAVLQRVASNDRDTVVIAAGRHDMNSEEEGLQRYRY